jgi:WD40 repeat protein/serine/threonine protein kinase
MSSRESEAARIFLEAVEHHECGQWADFVREAAAGDPLLMQRVDALLKAHGESNYMLDRARLPPTGDIPQPTEGPGTMIGPYKLLEQIGEGGMGLVFMAEQSQPVRRKVALKVLKAGMDTRQVVARFEAERQALALMDHPNIARVFDGGGTEAGRPYFVMELVKGVPITEFCDQNHLTPRQRLELFIPVCQAVQHAHQKGIIHRDLKPSNVLVSRHDTTPAVKVIDFGVAKALGQTLTDKTLFTGIAQMVGTPLYMSPEQAGMSDLDVDTRSDIYSLGVLLYELLTGSTPFTKERFKQAGYDEIRRIIREEEPPRPSTRLSESKDTLPSISAQRQTEPAKLTRLVRGELDWIVMKALEKDRNRRYETANGFAIDVQRYLADEPVLACPPSAAYRLRKFVRRNRGPVLAATVIVLLLIGGIVGTTLGLLQAQESAVKAGQDRDQANEARLAAQKAGEEEKLQRNLAVERARELRRNLYPAHMNLASQAARRNTGLDRVDELVSHWRSGQPDMRGWEWYYLFGLCHQDLATISASPHGPKQARVINAFQQSEITSVAWSPDGTRLATTGSIGPRVWDAATGKEALILETPRGWSSHSPTVSFPEAWQSSSLTWSPDGTLLASGEYTGKIAVWDGVTGKHRLTFQGHSVLLHTLAWAPEGTRLASASGDGTIRVWDARTGKSTLILKVDTAPVRFLAWSPDGTQLAAVDTSMAVTIYEATGKRTFKLDRPANLGMSIGYYCVSWSPNGKLLAMHTSSGFLIWDVSTAKPILVTGPGRGGPAGVYRLGYCVSWSPDGKRLALGDAFGDINLCDAATGEVTVTLRGHSPEVMSLAWSPDGKRLASVSMDGTVKLWDANQKDDPVRALNVAKQTVSGLSWSPNGKHLATAAKLNVKIWDVEARKEVLTLPHDGVYAVSWASDGRHLASGSDDKTVKIWDAITGKECLTLKGHTFAVKFVAWHPDGKRLASLSEDGTVKVWNPITGEGIDKFKFRRTDPPDGVTSVSWSPDGTRLASTSPFGAVRICDADTGESLRILEGHPLTVNSVAWSPDGACLASASNDRTIKIWDAATGKEILTLKGHTGLVWKVSWSPGGTRLASFSFDGCKIWDPVTGNELIALEDSLPQYSAALAWSPDGLRLAVPTGFGLVFIYDAAPGLRHPAASAPADRSKLLNPPVF